MKDFTRALHSTRKRIRIQELFKLKCSVSFHSTTDRPQIKLHTLFKFTIAFHFGKKLKRIVCFDEIFPNHFSSSTNNYAFPVSQQITQRGDAISRVMSNPGGKSSHRIRLDQGWLVIGTIRDWRSDNPKQRRIFQYFNRRPFEVSSSWKLHLQGFQCGWFCFTLCWTHC